MMISTEELSSMTADLLWAEQTMGIRWEDEEVFPNKINASLLDSRVYLAYAMRDNDREGDAQEFLERIIETEINWIKQPYDVRLSAIDLAIELSLIYGKKSTGSKSGEKELSEREEYARKACGKTLSMVSSVLDDTSNMDSNSRERAVRMWGRAIAIAAWAQRGIDFPRAYDILILILESEYKSAGYSEIDEAIAYAIDSSFEFNFQNKKTPTSSLIQDGTINPERVFRELITLWDPEVVRNDSNPKWLVSAVGSLTHLSQFLGKDSRKRARELTINLVNLWDDTNYQDSNSGWAIQELILGFNLIATSNETVGLEESEIDVLEMLIDRKPDLLVRLLAKSSALASVLCSNRPKVFQTTIDVSLQFIRQLEDHDWTSMEYLYYLSKTLEFSDSKQADDIFETIHNASIEIQYAFLYVIRTRPLENWDPGILDRLGPELGKFVANQNFREDGALRSVWLESLCRFASIAYLNQNLEAIIKTSSRLIEPEYRDTEAWFSVINIGILSLRNDSPEQLRSLGNQALEFTKSIEHLHHSVVHGFVSLINELVFVDHDLATRLADRFEQKCLPPQQ